MQYFNSEEYTIDYLNESNEMVDIGGLEYEVGTLLYRADPIAFRQIELEILDDLISDGKVIEEDDKYYWTY